MATNMAGAAALFSLGMLAVLGLLNAPNVLRRRPFNYRAFTLGGAVALGIFAAAIIMGAVVRSIWLVVGMLAFWVAGVCYLYFGLRFLSRSFERHRRQ